ncbi:MAG: hypothetical protein WC499_02615 [Patescibacteria group bacterium]
MSKKIKIKCPKCPREFNSKRGLASHSRMHPYIPPTPPRKTVKNFIRTEEVHRLIAGTELKLGDKVEFIKKGVISKITLTENSNVAEVEISVTKDAWNRDLE